MLIQYAFPFRVPVEGSAQAAEIWLPHEIAFRKKNGFSVPVAQWLGDEVLRAQVENALFSVVSAAYFDQAILKRLWDQFLNGQKLHWKIVYAVLMIVIWHECRYEPSLEDWEL